MIKIFLSLSLAIFSYQLFSLTAKISGLNKTMINLPLSIFSYSVPLVDQEKLFFDKAKLENELDEYFKSSVSRFVGNYETKYTYYSTNSDSICMSSKCDTINVSLSANIDGLYQYQRTMRFSLGNGNNG